MQELHAGDWKDDKRGRPLVKDKKIKVPRVVVRQSTLSQIEDLSKELNISRSEIFQRALEAFIIVHKGKITK